MNPLGSIRKHLSGLEEALGKVKTEETRGKAKAEIWGWVDKVVPRTFTASLDVMVDGGKEEAPATVLKPMVPFCAPLDVLVGVVVQPALESAHNATEHAKEEAPGAKPEDKTVPPVDGWPVEAKIKVAGLFPNRRRLRGELEDGRIVAVERKPGVQTGSLITGKLVLGGRPPLYRVVEQAK